MRAVGLGGEPLELDDVVFEHRDGERGAIGEMPVEAALADPGALGDLAEGRAEARFGIDLSCSGDESAPVGGPGSGTAVCPGRGLRSGRHGNTLLPDKVVR